MQILLVDDEVEMAAALSRALTREGHTVKVAATGEQGSQLAQQERYDLLILDWMLPQQSGLEICQQVRSRGDATPILFLTAKDTLDDRVEGLDAGADDYLVKPFELRELLARVRALLRRPSGTIEPAVRLRAADLELDVVNQVAYRQGRTIELSEKEVQLLQYLMRHPNQLLTHDQIYQHLWEAAEKPTSNALAAQIRLLRRKIEADGEATLISTIYGRGYRFGTFVEEL
ncbi:MAG TPA: two-component system response regulator RppA [Thermosynechococcaceae cyanobacterium]